MRICIFLINLIADTYIFAFFDSLLFFWLEIGTKIFIFTTTVWPFFSFIESLNSNRDRILQSSIHFDCWFLSKFFVSLLSKGDNESIIDGGLTFFSIEQHFKRIIRKHSYDFSRPVWIVLTFGEDDITWFISTYHVFII